MNCKLPIRTYERKKFKEITIPLQVLHTSTINNIDNSGCLSLKEELKRSKIEKKDDSDNSMFYDPFDTTFDRLVRNTRVPTQSLKIQSVKASCNTTDSSFNSDIPTSEAVDYKCSLYDDIRLSNVNMKLIPKQKVVRRKLKMQVEKKTMSRRNKSASQNNGKFKVKKNNSYKKHKLRKARNNKKTTSNNTNIDSLYSNSEINTSKIEDHHNNYNKEEKKSSNKKYVLKQDNKNGDVLNFNFSRGLKINACSVVLEKFNVLDCSNKMSDVKNNLSKKTQRYILDNQESLEHPEITNPSINSVKHENINMKHCFVKVEQLEITSVIKPYSSSKKYENVISSTPIGRSVRHSTHLLSLSPIPIRYSEQLNKSITCIDNISTSANNKDFVSLEPKQMHVDLYGKSEVSEKHIVKEKTKLLSIHVTNASNFPKCSLNQSEELDKKSTDSLATPNCSSNNICEQQEHLTQEISEELFDSMQNILTTKIKKNNILDASSKLTQEHTTVDRSRSLFGDTNENIQTSLYDVNITNNIVKVFSSNLISDETNKGLNNETYSNSIELSKKSTLNINNNKIEVMFDKMKEESYKMLMLAKSTILDTSSGAVEFQLRTENIDFESNNTSIIKETEGLFSKNNTISTKKSFISDDKNCNTMEPCVVLQQLQDPIRITRRRKRYRKWELDLTDVSENCNNNIQFKEEQIYSNNVSESKKTKISRKTLRCSENRTETSIKNTSVKIEKPIYLKPGKSWARSLSILNNIQKESNLDELSVGKGRKWRHVVTDVLNMQKQGIVQSCVRKTENENELKVSNETINKSEHELANSKGRTCDSISLGRLTRRISVRVVPINKSIKSIEDTSFLEVYGIVPVKNQRFTLISDPRKSSVCNIRNDDVDGEIVEEYIVSPAKEVILERCFQEDYIPFSTYFSDSFLEHCRKIGEGVYGEVFLYEHEDKRTVIKIIPIEGNEYVNGEPQKKFHEILSEIVIAMELHNLRFNTKYNTDGFVEVQNIKCLKGQYPEKLVELWNVYDEEKRSENDCPSVFNDDQLYIILELGHGGQDLEAFVFNTAEEAHILFIQAALALAVAEKAVEFEHRDLHWGNILISSTNESHVRYKLGQKEIKLISKGVKVSIIDFTLSRITYQGCSVFNDLASDPSLFTAQGEYQFEIYRLMRDKIKNTWQKFEPYTNVLWLHYTLDKMITAVRYRRKNLKIHKNGIVKLKELKNEILTYSSAYDFVTNCDKIVNLLCTDTESELAFVLKEEMVIV